LLNGKSDFHASNYYSERFPLLSSSSWKSVRGEKKLISLRQEARENIPKIEFHMPFVTKGLGIAGNYDEWIINCVAFA
jgi:ribosomal protein L32E